MPGPHDDTAIDTAARLLLDVAAGRAEPPAALPDGLSPATIEAGHAIQDRALALSGESAGAMKVLVNEDGVLRGLVPQSRIWSSPATLAPGTVRLCGVEGEIAFRLDSALPQRATPYTAEEIAGRFTALVAIEVVDTRLVDTSAPFLDRLADNLCNGGLVTGTVRADWRTVDLTALEVVLTVNGSEAKRLTGGLACGDPLPPAVALLNVLAAAGEVPAGFIVTTGSYSGLDFVSPGDHVSVRFTGFGEAEMTFPSAG